MRTWVQKFIYLKKRLRDTRFRLSEIGRESLYEDEKKEALEICGDIHALEVRLAKLLGSHVADEIYFKSER